MMYQLKILESVEKELDKLDKQTVCIIKNWIVKNLVDTEDPCRKGKALQGNLSGIWRYRVGYDRLFARIDGDVMTIFLFDVGRERDIYK